LQVILVLLLLLLLILITTITLTIGRLTQWFTNIICQSIVGIQEVEGTGKEKVGLSTKKNEIP